MKILLKYDHGENGRESAVGVHCDVHADENPQTSHKQMSSEEYRSSSSRKVVGNHEFKRVRILRGPRDGSEEAMMLSMEAFVNRRA